MVGLGAGFFVGVAFFGGLGVTFRTGVLAGVALALALALAVGLTVGLPVAADGAVGVGATGRDGDGVGRALVGVGVAAGVPAAGLLGIARAGVGLGPTVPVVPGTAGIEGPAVGTTVDGDVT